MKESNNSSYIDRGRKFIIDTFNNYNNGLSKLYSAILPPKQIDLKNYNFSGSDFREIPLEVLDLFDFSYANLSNVKIGRTGIDFLKNNIKLQNIRYNGLCLDGANLGPALRFKPELGINCYHVLNLSNLKLANMSFKNSNLQDVIFDDSDINGCNFSESVNMQPKQFAYSLNFDKATFYNHIEEDASFKEKILKLSKKMRPTPKPHIPTTQNPIAIIFDNADRIRIDDPYILSKDEQ